MSTMTERKRPRGRRPSDEPPKRPNRVGIPITFWVPVELRAAADAYRGAQRFPPDLTAILRQALQDFLEREGYWPPPPASPE
jgi:hypothetical protein